MSARELTAFAEQILFGDTLADKQVQAERLLDRDPQPALTTVPAQPARPLGLEPDRAGRRPFRPGRLETQEDRVRLLHALANHELLALELMALVLLRFPDAPTAFRRDLGETMQDEQRHLGLYLNRLQELGHELGEEPLSGYFWRALSDVSSPLDYVVRMPLTFEQANLDFARHYAEQLRLAGDPETAEILELVYRDEIGHVGSGLRWFREWRAGGSKACDWESYLHHLPPPLTASRAKGPVFDVEGRRKAGFGPRFLRELRIFSSSKGRPPVVHVFNPGCELEQADGRAGYCPPKFAELLAADLAPSLAFLARRDDLVGVPRKPTTAWLEGLRELGWELPEFLESPLEELPARLGERTLGGLRPWGWSPRVQALLSPCAERLSGEASIPTAAEVERLGQLAHKGWAVPLAAELHAELGEALLGPRCRTVAALCEDEDQARVAVEGLAARGSDPVVVKAPWGSSGRGAIRLLDGTWAPAQLGWLRKTLRSQGSVLVEPWLRRRCDLSIQLVVEGASVRELGVTRFLADERGQFRGCVVGPALHGLDAPLLRALHGDGMLSGVRRAGALVGERLRAEGYRGPVGVDAFLYELDGAIRLRPLVEINPRLTMGRLALALGGRLAPGKQGSWRQLGRSELKPDPLAAAAARAAENPPRVDGLGRLQSGVVFTNDPAQATVALGLLEVRP